MKHLGIFDVGINIMVKIKTLKIRKPQTKTNSHRQVWSVSCNKKLEINIITVFLTDTCVIIPKRYKNVILLFKNSWFMIFHGFWNFIKSSIYIAGVDFSPNHDWEKLLWRDKLGINDLKMTYDNNVV